MDIEAADMEMKGIDMSDENMESPVLEMRKGSFSYDTGRMALCNVSATIRKGEKIAVIGSNGSGKSTFFLALNGVLKLSDGALYYRGERVAYTKQERMRLRKGVGIVFQDSDNQIIGPTVEGEISFGLFNLGMKRDEVKRRVLAVMEEHGLEKFLGRPPHLLSGGEKKRVTIADILAMEPEVILFDEPASSLDGYHTRMLMEQLERLHKEQIALVVSTHDMNFVWEWADRVLVFGEGRLLADGTAEQIFENDALLEDACLVRPILFELPGRPRTIDEYKAINYI